MIVKIPIYFEIDGKFSSDQVSELIAVVQGKMTSDLNDLHGRDYSWKVFGRKQSLKLLTHEEVKERIIS